ncbi:LytR C-terminal domain-containing protein [Aromatoleum anaerobium]|uniref:Tetratricopeptide repeat protein n=1 Tax=Aromatoleum anaerobium TaxID=182180 RepID=A0ABX1PQZ9_9RHOO|nr:LytR C-terminal domain-containing protein [Aromatoleum anaerobium]MCK0506453.1 tetratricopeptide repeat protein [Aromatoleum anaerobium]
MNKLAPTLTPVFAALVLAACSTSPTMPENAWKVAPVQTVRHGGASAAAGYFALGRYREGRGADEEAIAAYRQALNADPGHAAAWNALGSLQAALGRFDDGVRALEQAVSLAPAASHLYNNLGYALLLAGRPDAAATSLRRAVELDGNNRRAWTNLATAYRRLGVQDKAEFAAAPGRAPAVTSPAMAVAGPAVSTTPSARLVKVAENVFELLNAPVRRDTAVVEAAAIITAVARPSALARPAEAFVVRAATPSVAEGLPPAAAPLPPASRPVRYEISNGHGGEGLARRLAGLLGQQGGARPRLTNSRPFDQAASFVEYRDGYREAATAFAAGLPFRPAIRATASNDLAVDVRLMLGRDLTSSDACAVLGLCARIARSPAGQLAAVHPAAASGQ